MKVTLTFLVLGMVMVAFAAGETTDDHQLSLDNDDDVDIAAMENLVNEERSEDDDDDTGLERSAAAEIEDDDEDRSAGDLVVEDRYCRGKNRRKKSCRNKRSRADRIRRCRNRADRKCRNRPYGTRSACRMACNCGSTKPSC